MMERARRSVVALLLCHSLSGCSGQEGGSGDPDPSVPSGDSAPPNVILISIDTLNRNALRAYDPTAPPLPALDAFADSARRFENAYSTASWTLPAHASLMTGLYPDRHGATARPQRLAPDTVTLAESLQRAGYQTAAFTEGGYLHEQFGFAKGFARYDQSPSEAEAGKASDGPWKKERRTGRPFERALEFLTARGDDAPPLFLFLHTYLVHDYFRLRPWAVEQTPGVQDRSRDFYLDCLIAKHPCSDGDWRRLQELYDLGLARVDQSLGRLLALLEQRGLRDSSIIVLLSDHGEGFDPDHARIHHAGRLHADLIRIPLLIAGPGVAPGTVTTPVSLVDIMPALLDHLALERPFELDGLSGTTSEALFSNTQPNAENLRTLYAMEHYRQWGPDGLTKLGELRAEPASIAVIRPDWWYIRSDGREELYSMSDDPKQRINRIDIDARAAGLARVSAGERSAHQVRPQPRGADEEVTRQLRALGYIE